MVLIFSRPRAETRSSKYKNSPLSMAITSAADSLAESGVNPTMSAKTTETAGKLSAIGNSPPLRRSEMDAGRTLRRSRSEVRRSSSIASAWSTMTSCWCQTRRRSLEQAQGEEHADRSQHKEEAVDHEAAIAVEHRHGGEEPNRDDDGTGRGEDEAGSGDEAEDEQDHDPGHRVTPEEVGSRREPDDDQAVRRGSSEAKRCCRFNVAAQRPTSKQRALAATINPPAAVL